MTQLQFSDRDLLLFSAKGISPDKVKSQINTFKTGIFPSRLHRACTIKDGITQIDPGEFPRLTALHRASEAADRIIKFVPASGAATRMFGWMLPMINKSQIPTENQISRFNQFIDNIEKFAFFPNLQTALANQGLKLRTLIKNKNFVPIIEMLLFEKGLNYSNSPKGLIKFHSYDTGGRTAFEEHLVEAAAYAKNSKNIARIHFTISKEHLDKFQAQIKASKHLFEKDNTRFEITFSYQKSSTDTVAVDLNNQPFRDSDGQILFRPSGHGALLENLADLNGDIVFIKNIDNVVHDRFKEDTFLYKSVLAGYLIELQNRVFSTLKNLRNQNIDQLNLSEIYKFVQNKLSINIPTHILQEPQKTQCEYLLERLNIPLRVCGMVRNVSEPGGGPFWVKQADGNITAQIVESSQVDMDNPQQREIWNSATHFNSVDLVCGLKDYQGNPFKLAKFVDPYSGFITQKLQNGKKLKALELPGLWNGSMARWNTVFVEVPITTFSPVKNVIHLLKNQHQPCED